MREKFNEKLYNIGLDIGTNSVGFAVTDLNGKLVKVKGKNFWGVRLFEEGKTAALRRQYRSTRRRLQRRKLRIKILQEIFADEINNVDPDFYKKLNQSFRHYTERNYKYNIFNEVGFNDKSFYEKYPTIYHLRYDLVKSSSKYDIRLIYLALHNIMKYRGNFLFEGQNLDSNKIDLKDEIKKYLNQIEDSTNETLNYTDSDVESYISIITNNNLNKIDKLKAVVIKTNDKVINASLKEFSRAILGNKFNFNKLAMLDDTEEKIEINFSDEYDENEVLVKISGYEDYYNVVYNLYNAILLSKITYNSEYISESMIKRFEKHKKDLAILKRFIKNNLKDNYNYIFRDIISESNYPNYINLPSKHNYDQFYKFILKVITSSNKNFDSDKDYKYIKDEIEKENFLRIIRIKDNSAIPYQLHLKEMKQIIDNQSKYYPFLKEHEDKIVKTMQFKIPYYIGPLSTKSEFGWLEKKTDDRILPWNFESVVDVEKSAEKFIKRMTNKCTYLINEDVLPKYSLLIQKYELYNELNKVRVNGKLITPSLKEKIVEQLFKNQKSVSLKALEKFLNLENNYIVVSITGTQKKDKFASSLSSYIDFTRIFGEINQSNIGMIEEIIYWITIFTDKKILKAKIKYSYPNISDNQLDQIMKLNYAGWSRLSKKLISGITTKLANGERKTILDILEETNLNFMQIISDDKYDFAKKIAKANEKNFLDKLTIEDVNEFVNSPSLRKGVWQAIKIVEEIISIMKSTPVNIYLEVTRREDKKVRTESRVDKLLKIYDVMKSDNEIYYLSSIHDELKNIKKKNEKLDNERLFLYFTQNGKCMYSGKSLSFDKLHTYEVDHIIPRFLKPDDSIDNKVLVIKGENQRKGESLILEDHIRKNNEKYWRYLNEKGLISDSKLYNLQRAEFSEKDIAGFVNRQLVETSQIIKNVALILSEYYKNDQVDVRLVRSQTLSFLRKDLKLYKIRNLNNYHHAHDAYLASVLGEFTRKYIRDNVYGKFVKEMKSNKYRESLGWVVGRFKQLIYDEDGQVLWNGEEKISTIKKTLNYKDCFITRKSEEQRGEFYNQTIVPKSSSKKIVPVKADRDPKLYGGYNNVNEAYVLLLEIKDLNDNTSYIPVSINRLEDQILRSDNNKLDEILSGKVDLRGKSYKVIRKIKKYQLAIVDGHLVYITSLDELNNAKQLYLSWSDIELLHKIEYNLLENNSENEEKLVELLKTLIEKMNNEYPLFRNIANKLLESIPMFKELDLNKKCSFILEVIKIMSPGAENANFKSFGINGLSDRVGRLRKSFKVNNTIFVDQSITGVYERKTKYGV